MKYYEAVKAALATLKVPYYHNKAHKQDSTYIVWSETGSTGLYASDRLCHRAQRIAVDLFTKTEYTTLPDDIIKALEQNGFAVYEDVGYDYEDDTGYIHHALTALYG